jgi:hypothetical protein
MQKVQYSIDHHAIPKPLTKGVGLLCDVTPGYAGPCRNVTSFGSLTAWPQDAGRSLTWPACFSSDLYRPRGILDMIDRGRAPETRVRGSPEATCD